MAIPANPETLCLSRELQATSSNMRNKIKRCNKTTLCVNSALYQEHLFGGIVKNYLINMMMGMGLCTMPLIADDMSQNSMMQQGQMMHQDQMQHGQMQQRPMMHQDQTQQRQMSQEEQCAREILMHHYPEKFVVVTLKKFQVPEDQQQAIVKELAEKDKNIVKMVENKAASMNPNPLKDPQLRQQAVRMFRETLKEQFASVLNAHGVTDDAKIQQMLDDIQLQKAKQFTECMEKMHPEIKQNKPVAGQPANANSDDDDDDDNDDDDNDDDDDDDNDDDDSN